MKIRIGSIADLECYYLDDDEGQLYGWYKEKVDNLSVYDVDDDVLQSRQPEYPDDVQVCLLKKDCGVEGCWVRIEGLDEENRRFFGHATQRADTKAWLPRRGSDFLFLL